MRLLLTGCMAVLALLMLSACSDDDNNESDNNGDATAGGELTVTQVGRFQVEPFAFDEGAAEIVAHDAALNRLFVVNSSAATVDVLDISDADNILKLGAIDATSEGAAANSVAVSGQTVAVAVEADDAQAPGKIVFYDTGDFSKLGEAAVGALPDMVTFTPDGQRVLVANEGEPNDAYDNDPQGSVSVVDVANGFDSAPGHHDRIRNVQRSG